MRIATWNVNSLNARLEKVVWWLDRARPDVLLMQETKLADTAAPVATFEKAGYELAHHGEGRWNGVAIASRRAIERRRDELRRAPAPRAHPRRRRRRAARRSADDRSDVRRDPGRLRVCTERTDRRLAVLRREARVVRASRLLARRGRGSRRSAHPRRRLQRRTRGHRRVGPAGVPRRDARLSAGASGVRPALHL